MKNKKFTLGPWKVGHRNNLIIGANGGSIANCLFTHSNSKMAVKPSPEDCMHNARLIATAPEMLEVLESMIAIQGDSEARYGHGLVTLEILNDARACIEKATGGSDV